MWAVSEQITLWYDWQHAASESEFAAVPLKTKYTSHAAPTTARTASAARAVHASSPYERHEPSFARRRASHASGHTPAVLSLAKRVSTRFTYHIPALRISGARRRGVQPMSMGNS